MTTNEIERTKEALARLQAELDQSRAEVRDAKGLLCAIIIENGGGPLFVSDLSWREVSRSDTVEVFRDEGRRGSVYVRRSVPSEPHLLDSRRYV
jgi:hypothetical protein